MHVERGVECHVGGYPRPDEQHWQRSSQTDGGRQSWRRALRDAADRRSDGHRESAEPTSVRVCDQPEQLQHVPGEGGSRHGHRHDGFRLRMDGRAGPSWVSVKPTKITGGGTTTVTVQSNTGVARSTTFRVAGSDFVVQQSSAPCSYLAGRATREVHYKQSTREIGVITQSHCPVSATENASWIQIVSAPAVGSGEIVIRVDETRATMSVPPQSRSPARILSTL